MTIPDRPRFLSIPPFQANWPQHVNTNFDEAESALELPFPVAAYSVLPDATQHQNKVILVGSGVNYELFISDGTKWSNATRTRRAFAQISQKDSQDQGTILSGTRNLRTFNTKEFDEIGITLAGTDITVPAGTYDFYGMAKGHACGKHMILLSDDQDNTLINGLANESEPSGTLVSTNSGFTESILAGRVTLASETVLQVQHVCDTSRSTDGLGKGWVEDGIFAFLQIWRKP